MRKILKNMFEQVESLQQVITAIVALELLDKTRI